MKKIGTNVLFMYLWLITAPTTLAAGPALSGGIAVAIMAGIVVALIVNANKKVKAEYKLN